MPRGPCDEDNERICIGVDHRLTDPVGVRGHQPAFAGAERRVTRRDCRRQRIGAGYRHINRRAGGCRVNAGRATGGSDLRAMRRRDFRPGDQASRRRKRCPSQARFDQGLLPRSNCGIHAALRSQGAHAGWIEPRVPPCTPCQLARRGAPDTDRRRDPCKQSTRHRRQAISEQAVLVAPCVRQRTEKMRNQADDGCISSPATEYGSCGRDCRHLAATAGSRNEATKAELQQLLWIGNNHDSLINQETSGPGHIVYAGTRRHGRRGDRPNQPDQGRIPP